MNLNTYLFCKFHFIYSFKFDERLKHYIVQEKVWFNFIFIHKMQTKKWAQDEIKKTKRIVQNKKWSDKCKFYCSNEQIKFLAILLLDYRLKYAVTQATAFIFFLSSQPFLCVFLFLSRRRRPFSRSRYILRFSFFILFFCVYKCRVLQYT